MSAPSPCFYPPFFPLMSLLCGQEKGRNTRTTADRARAILVIGPTVKMADTIQEVLPFLDDEKSNVRTEALKILAHLVNESNADLFYERSVFAKIMQCLSTVDSSEVVVQAAILLINLIAENPSVPEDAGLVEKLMEVLQQNTLDEHTNTFLMLLANATVSESACHILFRNCSDYLQPFMEKYLEYNPQLEDDSVQDFATVDRWQYFSNVLCNICRLEEGRRVILNKSSNNMTRLLRQVCIITQRAIRLTNDIISLDVLF